MSNEPLLNRIPICEHGSPDLISRYLLGRLSELENFLSFDLHFNSGYRCAVCNKAAGGVPNSGHMRGVAVDIAVPDSNTRFRIVQGALKCSFRRIGIGKNFVHLDVDDSLPQTMLWVYT
jgi:uncharacterized protein YcbK (DUF882 family)